MMFIDSHCHLNYPQFSDLTAVLDRAEKCGVKGFLTVCTKLGDMLAITDLVEVPSILGSVGVHPHESALHDLSSLRSDLEHHLAHPKIVALGETGLDYYYNHSPKDIQQESFRIHLEVAQTLNIPIIIHTRDAQDDTIRILQDFPRVRGVFHCFSGTKKLSDAALELGFYLSFSGIITFKNAKELQDIVAITPLDRILIETDSPYLTPHPHRGPTNEPSYVALVAEKVAQLKGMDIEAIATATTHNFSQLFNKK